MMVFLGIVTFSAIIIWVFPTTGHFQRSNPFWNGLADFIEQFNARPLASLADLSGEQGKNGLLIIPAKKPSAEDISEIKLFLNRGGTVILADDFGFGNEILEGLGVDSRFDGATLMDGLFNYRNSFFPLVSETNRSPLTDGVARLALNYGTGLNESGMTVVAHSSRFSFLDRDNDGHRSLGDLKGPIPVAAYDAFGAGQLVLISDPSIFINSMLLAEDNTEFVSNLVGTLDPQADIFLAESLLPESNLTRSKEILTHIRVAKDNPGILAAISALIIIGFMSPIWRLKE
jgi:hypothetical protein